MEGAVETIAGLGTEGFSGDGQQAKLAELSSPSDVSFDDQGRLLIVDSGNRRIRRVDLDDGVISTVVGTGNLGNSEDGPDPLTKDLNEPVHGVFLPAGKFIAGATGGLYVFSERSGHRIRVWMDLQVPGFPLAGTPSVFTLAGDGVAGDRDHVDGRQARFRYPRVLAWYGGALCDGPCLLLLDSYDRMRLLHLAVTPFEATPLHASVTTLRGEAKPRFDGHFSEARLFGPSAILQVQNGLALISERNTGRIRALDFDDEQVATLSGIPAGRRSDHEAVPLDESEPLREPADMVLDNRSSPWAIYITERSSHTIRRVLLHDRSLPSTWTIERFCGQNGIAGHRDGSAHEALFDGPNGLALDATGRILFVSEYNNQTIRKVDLEQELVTTIAGTPNQIGSFGDNDLASDALFFHPGGLALTADSTGAGLTLYIADTDNHRIRRIDNVLQDFATVHTVLGDGSSSSSGEGGPAKFFPVNTPTSVFVDPGNNLYATSQDSIRILLSHDDGFADGNDRVASIYGAAPRHIFPEPITTCLQDFYFDFDENEIFAIDECLGIILRLHREQSSTH